MIDLSSEVLLIIEPLIINCERNYLIAKMLKKINF